MDFRTPKAALKIYVPREVESKSHRDLFVRSRVREIGNPVRISGETLCGRSVSFDSKNIPKFSKPCHCVEPACFEVLWITSEW